MKKEESSSLAITVSGLKKEFGDDIIFYGRSQDKVKQIERIPSGSLAVDLITGGGYAVGQIHEIYGRESVGKTALVLLCIAAMQKLGKKVVFIDVESVLNYDWAEKLGVDTENWLISRPSSGEAALETVDRLVRCGEIDLIALDSVAALVSQEELDKPMSKDTMAKQARLMSQALRKFGAWATKTRTTLLFINQTRIDIKSFFPRPVTPGGEALKFWAAMRIELKCIKKRDDRKGHTIKITATKNKTAPPFLSSTINLVYNEPLREEEEIFDLAKELDILKHKGKAGGHYYLDNQKNIIGHGRESVVKILQENKELAQKIKERIVRILT